MARRSRVIDQSGYGRKGGTSATSGKTSRKIVATINGVTYSKRVFLDQQFLVVSFVNGKPVVTAWSTEEKAVSQRDYARRDGVSSDYALAKTV